MEFNKAVQVAVGELNHLSHHFAGGVYAKEMHWGKNSIIPQHKHSFDHMSILVSGSAIVSCDGSHIKYDAPAFINIEKEKYHTIVALTDIVWACLHATTVTDPEQIDATLISPGD